MFVTNLVGMLLIVLIIWWFWLSSAKKKPKTLDKITNKNSNVVLQNGVYQPSTIVLSANTSNTLTFIRKDPSPCAATVIFPDFQISEELPLNKTIEIALPAMKKGKYVFHCQMQMYKGYVILK